MSNNYRSELSMIKLFLVCIIMLVKLTDYYAEAGDKGDDIILAKGKIIMRGGKGKGNIILDPGSHASDEGGHHHMSPMMSLMGHFNPYAFYPMHGHQQHQQEHHHQPPMMIRPIYIEDHSAMHQHQHVHEPEQHHVHEQHHGYHHHEEPQHQHEHNEMMEHHHYEPEHHHQEPIQEQHHYEHDGSEHHEGGGAEEEHQNNGYHHMGQHPMMAAMMMHGSGPFPAYQQANALQTIQQQQSQQAQFYSRLPPEQQVAAFQQAHLQALAEQNLDQGVSSQQQQTTSEEASQTSASPPSGANEKPSSRAKLLLEKSANSPLVQMIKPLFKRNKDNKDAGSTPTGSGSQKQTT